MTDVSLKAVEAWCQDALTLLPTPELPAGFTEQRRATIRRHSGTKLIYKIAEDLAEGVSELPIREREAADRTLKDRRGFGYELFTDKKLKRLRAIFRKGKISSDEEFREMSALANDTEIDAELRKLVDKLLFDYESQTMQTPKQSSVVLLKKKPQ